MQQHELDPLSLFAGLAFSLTALAYALTHVADVHLRWIAVLPAALIAVGATILAIVVRRARGEVRVESTADVQ
jgi:hypothetical protein